MPFSPRPPGTLFLRTVRLLFADETVSSVFLPALADFQDEVRQASSGRQTRVTVRCRWYWALTVLLVIVPFSLATLPVPDRSVRNATRSGHGRRRLLVGSLFAGPCAWLFVMAPRCGQEFVVASLFGGMLLACGMRTWNDCHAAGCDTSIRLAALTITAMNRARFLNRPTSEDSFDGRALRSSEKGSGI